MVRYFINAMTFRHFKVWLNCPNTLIYSFQSNQTVFIKVKKGRQQGVKMAPNEALP